MTTSADCPPKMVPVSNAFPLADAVCAAPSRLENRMV